MTDDNHLAEGALSRDPDKAHADAHRARLAQQRAASKRYYHRKLSKRVRKDAEDESEKAEALAIKAEAQAMRDELLQARDELLASGRVIDASVNAKLDALRARADAFLARQDAEIAEIDGRMRKRADKLARAKADAEEGEIGPPLAETPGTTPQPSPADPRHLDSPGDETPFWHPKEPSL
jgi:hypothetical protein